MSENKKYTGVVIWFNATTGLGFLSWSGSKDGQDMFVHYSDIVAPNGGFKTLKKDQKVEFEIGKNNRGQDKAIEVIVLS